MTFKTTKEFPNNSPIRLTLIKTRPLFHCIEARHKLRRHRPGKGLHEQCHWSSCWGAQHIRDTTWAPSLKNDCYKTGMRSILFSVTKIPNAKQNILVFERMVKIDSRNYKSHFLVKVLDVYLNKPAKTIWIIQLWDIMQNSQDLTLRWEWPWKSGFVVYIQCEILKEIIWSWMALQCSLIHLSSMKVFWKVSWQRTANISNLPHFNLFLICKWKKVDFSLM